MDRIKQFLARQPATRRAISQGLGIDYFNLQVGYLVESRDIMMIGTVEQARAAGIDFNAGELLQHNHSNPHAGVYALPGTPLLPLLEPDVETCIAASRRLPKYGGGKVAGPRTIRGYRWPSIGQWRGRGGE